MNKFTRALSLALAAVTAAGCLAACGSKTKLPDKQTVDHVYRYTTTELATHDEVKWDDDNTNFKGYTQVEDTALTENGYLYRTVSVDKDYNITATSLTFGKFDGSAPTEITLDAPKNEQGWMYLAGQTVTPRGAAVVVVRSEVVGEQGEGDAAEPIYENTTMLLQYGFDGTLLSETELTPELFGLTVSEGGYFNTQQMLSQGDDLYFTVSADDPTVTGTLFCLDASGKAKESVVLAENGAEYIQSIFFFGEDKLFFSYYDMNAGEPCGVVLDLATGERTSITRTTFPSGYSALYSAFGGADGMYIDESSDGIYKLDPTTGTQTLLLDYINSDFIYNASNVYGNSRPFVGLSDDRFAALLTTTKNGKSTTSLTLFEPADPASLVPKYLITVASAGYSYNFQEQVVKFNLSSDEYRIKYVNYSDYNTSEDYTLGEKQLNSDLLAGNIPDVLISDAEFQATKYINKGIFANLYDYMDKDSEVTRDSFLPNILAACEVGGKLYELPSSFGVFGMMGEKSKIAEFDNLTLREFADKVAALPEDVSFVRPGDYSRDQMLRVLLFINYSDYVNAAAGTCDFDNDEFRAMLEFIKTVPEKSRWEEDGFDADNYDWDAYDNMYKEGKAIAEFSGFGSFFGFEDMAYTFGNLETDLAGLPSKDRNGYAFTSTNLQFLISAKSPFADEAWNFVRLFFTDEAQTSLEYGFPVTKTALEKAKQSALDTIASRSAEDDEGTGEIIGWMSSDGGEARPIYDNGRRKETAADVERIYAVATSVSKLLVYDESVFDVIWEEATSYFSGEKSVDEVAKLINNRVSIVLSETR